MAKLAKSKDQANYRKAIDVKLKDHVVVARHDEAVIVTSGVASISSGLYMGRRGYVFTTESGYVIHAAGNEYVEGRYPLPSATDVEFAKLCAERSARG